MSATKRSRSLPEDTRLAAMPGSRPGMCHCRVFRWRGRRDAFAGGPGQGKGKLQEAVWGLRREAGPQECLR